jgi:hypothetical protein
LGRDLVYAWAAILQLDKAKQQEKEDELKIALHENDARHDEHLKALESRIAVRACLPARQTASQPNCLPAARLPACPPARLSWSSGRAYVECELYEGRARVARVCTYMHDKCMSQAMHKHAAAHALRFPSPAIWQCNGTHPNP